MAYTIVFSKQAAKQLEKIQEPYYSSIKEAIIDLSENPRPHGHIKLKGRDGYRIRVGVYRIIYEIVDDVLMIEILVIGHRKDVYE